MTNLNPQNICVDADGKIELAEAVYALQAAAHLIDSGPPLTVGGPSVSGTTYNGTTLVATIDENGTGYYLVQNAGMSAPTPAEVEQANNSFPMTGNVQAVASIGGLSASTAYKVYFVAKDMMGNLQSCVILRMESSQILL